MNKVKGLKSKDLEDLKDILAAYPIEIAYLYGSYAEGTNRSWSDFDVGIIACDSIRPEKYLDLEIEISKKIDARLPGVESDVRIFNQAPLNYKIQVVQNGKLLFSGNEKRRVNFETLVRDEYFDFLPKREEYRAAFQGGIEKGGLLWSTPKK